LKADFGRNRPRSVTPEYLGIDRPTAVCRMPSEREIYGVGRAKLEQYCPAFLEVVLQHRRVTGSAQP
jgi:hypothetical protein